VIACLEKALFRQFSEGLSHGADIRCGFLDFFIVFFSSVTPEQVEVVANADDKVMGERVAIGVVNSSFVELELGFG
jgi:hypothetical protein